jgi:hypothetical protein
LRFQEKKMTPAWVKSAIEQDTEMARDLQQAARKAAQEGYLRPGAPSISSGATAAEAEVAVDSRRALESAMGLADAMPFFRRVTALAPGHDAPRVYCITDVRSVASIGNYTNGDYCALGWTSPIAARIPAGVGQEFPDLRRAGVVWKIIAQSRYSGQLLPQPTAGRLESERGAHELTATPGGSPEILVGRARAFPFSDGVPAGSRPSVPKRQVAGSSDGGRSRGGLVNIAASADHEQWKTFHHDLHGHVLVEGPPGSGKTSVALMRIPCLIDRQWEELGLQKGVDRPRYSEAKTLVVIANKALLATLGNLMADLGIRGIAPSELKAVLEGVLAPLQRLRPRELREETTGEAALSREGRFLGFLEQGLYRHALGVSNALPPSEEDGAVNTAAIQSLKTRLINWAETIRDGGKSPLDKSFAEWLRQHTDEARRNGPALRKVADDVVRRVFDRRAILTVVFERLQSGQIAGADLQAWRDAWKKSESSATLGEWCALGTIRCRLFSNDDEAPTLAGASRPAPPTHIVVDEAQDMGLSEFQFLRARLAVDGVMTLSGDPSQAEKAADAGAGWSGVHADDFHRISLGINYRQSRAIGEFVREVFAALYRKEARWKTDTRRDGIPVRIENLASVQFIRLVPDGILSILKSFRKEFPNDTLGVIHHGDALLTDQVVTHLESNGFWEVRRAEDLATGVMGKVVVGTAWELRGLEFPAAVVLDLECSGVADELGDAKVRNALYVGVSRACDRLAVLVRNGESGKLLASAAARASERLK